MNEELIVDIVILLAGCFVCSRLIPSGSLGFIKIGRDDFGKWHIWWERH